MSDDALELLLDGLAVLLVEALLVDGFLGFADARRDGGDGGEEAEREQEVRGPRHVVADGEGAGDGSGELRGEEVQDVEGGGQADEGDGEVDGGRVNRLLERVLGLAVGTGRGRLVTVIEETDGTATVRWSRATYVVFLLASILAGCGTGAGLRLALSSSESRDLERGREGSADIWSGRE